MSDTTTSGITEERLVKIEKRINAGHPYAPVLIDERDMAAAARRFVNWRNRLDKCSEMYRRLTEALEGKP